MSAPSAKHRSLFSGVSLADLVRALRRGGTAETTPAAVDVALATRFCAPAQTSRIEADGGSDSPRPGAPAGA